jgi:hypothetical protein
MLRLHEVDRFRCELVVDFGAHLLRVYGFTSRNGLPKVASTMWGPLARSSA